MQRKFFILIVILILLFTLDLGISANQELPPLSVDKEVYEAEETVEVSINIDSNEYGLYELFIRADNNSFTYKGEFNPIMFFYPTEEGIYTMALVEKSTGAFYHTISFMVNAKPGEEEGDIADYVSSQSEFEEFPDEQPDPDVSYLSNMTDLDSSDTPKENLLSVYTDKTEYIEGQRVRVFVEAANLDNVLLYHSFNGVSKRYMGDLRYISFKPVGVGTHELILEDSSSELITVSQFRVKPIIVKGTLRLVDSMGKDESVEVNFFTEDDGTSNIEVLPGKVRGKEILKKIKLRNLRFIEGKNLSLGIDQVPVEKINIRQKQVVKAFAIDPSDLNFTNGTATGVAAGSELWKCREWDFGNQHCLGTWQKVMDLIPGQEYDIELSPEDPGYAETGVASINTKKPIYHLNETAEIVIVVLDTGGYLVPDAEVHLTITAPNNIAYSYFTLNNGIIETSRGIYEVNFSNTGLEGNYSLRVNAIGSNVNSTMFSYFSVRSFYEFDILRDSPVTTDPWRGVFDSSIRIISYNGATNFNFTEVLPGNFTIGSHGGARRTDSNGKIFLTWTNLINKSVVSYSARPPLVTPDLYELGPSFVSYSTGTFYEARPWYLAVDPTAYYDPESNVQQGWNDGTGTGFDEINNSVRNPLTAGMTADYISARANDLSTSEYGFASITQTPSYITLWIIANTTNCGFLAYLQQDGSTLGTIDVNPSTSLNWFSYNWTNPTGVYDNMTVEFYQDSKGLGGPGYCYVYEAYIEVGYNNPPNVTNLTYPGNGDYFSSGINIDFNFTVYDGEDPVANCTLWGNFSGTWEANKTVYNVAVDTETNISIDLPSGSFVWNVNCTDAYGASDFYDSNLSLVVDTTYPTIDYSSGTEPDDTYFNRDRVYVNVSVVEDNEKNITFRLYNTSGPVNISTYTTSVRDINFTNLDSNMEYWYNVTVCDIVGWCNTTQTWKITLDSTYPSVNLEGPGNDTFTNDDLVEFNYTPIDRYLDACILYGNFTGPFAQNETEPAPVNNSINTFGPINLSDGTYIWNVMCNDSAGNNNFSTYNYTIKVDTQSPVITNWNANGTDFTINYHICLNVTVTDSFSGVQTVRAEIERPDLSQVNLTLLDNGLGCDAAGGDNVYSASYMLEITGNYTWLETHANDYANNWQTNTTNIEWNVTSTGSMSVLMVYPSSNIKINESEYNYEYQQTCNVSCDVGGVNCENITLYAQYKPSAFLNINTSTTQLINDEDNFSCGDLTAGGAPCSHTFNITSGVDSGGNTWLIRCSASSDSVGTYSSTQVNLTINDHPYPEFFYPANNSWLSGVEMLNASNSSDSDGSIVNYWFEYDNNTGFTSPGTLCNGPDVNCTWNISQQQNQCENNSMSCYLRINVTDNDGLTNSTYLLFGIDINGPVSTLDEPSNFDTLSGLSTTVNASVVDNEVGTIDTITFEYRQNASDTWTFACSDSDGSAPFECSWSLVGLPEGDKYQVRAYANDSLGNIGGFDTHTNITIDNSAPVVRLISPPDDSTDTDGDITFVYNVSAVTPILNCSLIVSGKINQTNDSVLRDQNQYFFLTGVEDSAQLNWSVNCTDSNYYINSSETWNVTVSLNADMNLNLELDKTVYYAGQTAVITNNITDSINQPISDVDLSTAIVFANTTIPWWNDSWERRKPLILSSTQDIINELIDVNITGLDGNISSCENEIRIVVFNSSSQPASVDRTILGGDDSTYCTVRFRANITSGVNNTDFMAYYNNSGASDPDNNVTRATSNTIKTAFGGSILGSQYDVSEGSYSDTISDNSIYYAVGRDNGNEQDPLNAYLNLSYNVSDLGVSESDLVTFNFTINYCHSDDVIAPLRCGAAVSGSANNPVNAQLYNFDSSTWYTFDTFIQNIASGTEQTDTVIESGTLDSYVGNTTGVLWVRYETDITLNARADASFVLDLSTLNVFYKERVYNVNEGVGETQLLIASNSSTTDLQGLWVWNWSTTDQAQGNYSAVSLASKTGYNNDYDYFWFDIVNDTTGPVVILDLPQNDTIINALIDGFLYIVNATVTDAGVGTIDTVTFLYRYNSTDTWKPACNDTDGSTPFECDWNLTGLANGNDYEVRVYANDTLGNVGDNDTHINITVIAESISITSIIVDDESYIPLDEIDLIAGTTKKVFCNVTVNDPDDYINIEGVNGTFYSKTTTFGAADNNRTHYTNNSCSLISGGGQVADFQCVYTIWHFAINGTWNCTALAWNSFTTANDTDNVTMNQLFAINISTDLIDYADLQPNQTSSDIRVNISNVGNMPMNISVYGFGGEDEALGSDLSMICEINNISVEFEKFSTSSGAAYGAKTSLSTTPQGIGMTIDSKTIETDVRINSTYWQFMVPPESYSYGECNGSVVFVAEAP